MICPSPLTSVNLQSFLNNWKYGIIPPVISISRLSSTSTLSSILPGTIHGINSNNSNNNNNNNGGNNQNNGNNNGNNSGNNGSGNNSGNGNSLVNSSRGSPCLSRTHSRRPSTRIDENVTNYGYSETDSGQRSRGGSESQMFPDVSSAIVMSNESSSNNNSVRHPHTSYTQVD